MKRREVIKNLTLGSLAFPRLIALSSNNLITTTQNVQYLKGNINHSVCRWTYDQLTIDQLCLLVKKNRLFSY